MNVLIMLTYNFLLVAGTAYLVEVCNWSMWTFLLTLCFFVTSSKSKDKEQE